MVLNDYVVKEANIINRVNDLLYSEIKENFGFNESGYHLNENLGRIIYYTFLCRRFSEAWVEDDADLVLPGVEYNAGSYYSDVPEEFFHHTVLSFIDECLSPRYGLTSCITIKLQNRRLYCPFTGAELFQAEDKNEWPETVVLALSDNKSDEVIYAKQGYEKVFDPYVSNVSTGKLDFNIKSLSAWVDGSFEENEFLVVRASAMPQGRFFVLRNRQ
jgi:hypothetical protein